VPPTSNWSRDPFAATVEDGRVFGLGSNDAIASVVAMTAATLRIAATNPTATPLLTLVADEETGGKGTELILPVLAQRGVQPKGVVVGEPTELNIAMAQRGMLILKLIARGDVCHSANAHALNATNAITQLAADISAATSLALGPANDLLGTTSLEPTLIEAGGARNALAEEATAILDIRSAPGGGWDHDRIIKAVSSAVKSEVEVISKRLEPRYCHEDAAVLQAARSARPTSTVYGSRTMSDMVFFPDTPTIKVGPGLSDRSHTPDEFVLESEILDGADFYHDLITAFVLTNDKEQDS
jgi:acetylornithine deacetylase